ncbi:hypothetical protein G7Z99_15525 [Pseudomonas entomophila]|uniref:hypothetical protein n=1 Tax=Pseudomonas entomophila TaxID=312306 RepID=UPI0015E39E90|nr:hypothetical protein [Pseudomonas entomophila]MBA1190444.1 hypothetical protein [Pseudomonas entomophila]
MPRYKRKRLSSFIRKWFVYITVVSLTGGSNRIVEHLSSGKLWQWVNWPAIKRVLVHFINP